MNTILASICANKRLEVARRKSAVPLSCLKERIAAAPPRPKRSLKEALTHSPSGIIAEFKRRSPSKGDIHPHADVTAVVRDYEAAGAAAISCLTDERFFGGSFADFEKARAVLTRAPLLRKDFIIDEYQLYQSKVMGADAVLLIAACLAPGDVARFAAIARELDMETLLEIHDERELPCVPLAKADVVGINNRDLKTFDTALHHTAALAGKLPASAVKISESGLSKPETVVALRRAGLQGFLIGEHFMRNPSPGEALKQFLSDVMMQAGASPHHHITTSSHHHIKIKVCGMKYPNNITALAALPVDMLGFIFYPPSPRFLRLAPGELPPLPAAMGKVGVFVDSDTPAILHTVAQYGLTAVQLHGQEPPERCAELRGRVSVIKAFHIATEADFRQCDPYAGACDYFLFDACTPLHGGAGAQFDWRTLQAYRGDTPFLLSGGICSDDAPALRQLRHPQLSGIDLNSRFETAPGQKDVNLLRQFIHTLHNS